MTKIHHVETKHEERWEFDPQLGPVRRNIPLVGRSGTEKIVHAGETFEVGTDGSFDVPDYVADFMCRMPGWHRGTSPFPVEEEPEKPRRAPRKPAE